MIRLESLIFDVGKSCRMKSSSQQGFFSFERREAYLLRSASTRETFKLTEWTRSMKGISTPRSNPKKRMRQLTILHVELLDPLVLLLEQIIDLEIHFENRLLPSFAVNRDNHDRVGSERFTRCRGARGRTSGVRSGTLLALGSSRGRKCSLACDKAPGVSTEDALDKSKKEKSPVLGDVRLHDDEVFFELGVRELERSEHLGFRRFRRVLARDRDDADARALAL